MTGGWALVFLVLLGLCPSFSFHAPTGTTRRALVVARASSEAAAVQIRSMKLSDVEAVSQLLVDTFEADLQWFEFPEKSSRRRRYRDALAARLQDTSGSSHLMALATLPQGKYDGIVGFVEAGFLPKPAREVTPEMRQQASEEEPTDAETKMTLGDLLKANRADDAPYLANLCVSSESRRLGLGRRLVALGIKWAEKQEGEHERVFVKVDLANTQAAAFYERLSFEPLEVQAADQARGRRYFSKPLR